MNVDTIKVELIHWIARLNDQYSINKILTLKKKLSTTDKSNSKIFGSGKHLIEYISDDFNKPLDDLETLLTLPFHHQDPFDRIIISQVKTKSLEIITNDSNVQKYFD